MGLLTTYFAATSDDDAAATVDRPGGPGGPGSPEGSTVQGDGIEPGVHLGTLEALLTGRSFDEVLDADDDPVVAERGGGRRFVLRVRAGLVDALVAAPDERIADVVAPWAATDELAGAAEQDLRAFVTGLRTLARTAAGDGHALYCWLSF